MCCSTLKFMYYSVLYNIILIWTYIYIYIFSIVYIGNIKMRYLLGKKYLRKKYLEKKYPRKSIRKRSTYLSKCVYIAEETKPIKSKQ